MSRLLRMFPALEYRNFRFFIIGQTISTLGQWMKRLALSWLVFRLTDSAFLLGIIEFVSIAPVLFLGLFAGTWLERHDLRKSYACAEMICMALSAVFSFVTLTDTATYPLLVALSLVFGLVTVFDMTARQTAVSVMVDDRSAIKSAIALNSMQFNMSKLVGPAVAGMLVYAFGEGICFLISTVTYLPLIYFLVFRMRFREASRPARKSAGMLEGMAEGIRYVKSRFYLRRCMQILFCFCVLSLSYTVLLPMFAANVLNGGSRTLGLLLGAVGIGAFLGGVVVSASYSLEKIPRNVFITSALTAAGMILFSMSDSMALSLPAVALIGFGVIATTIGINTLCQSTADESHRSRVVGIYIMLNMGIGPFGGLFFGGMADLIGAPATMTVSAACLLGIILYFLRDLGRISADLNSILMPRKEAD
ncbi:MAG: MFS transporter [Mailhella sp.]|nr:MFS transporter [Mailhella sp.]